MTIYVNNGYTPEGTDRGGLCWYQLVSDTSVDELHEFAAGIGLASTCFYPGRQYGTEPSRIWRSHYDLTVTGRDAAVRAGARPITLSEFCGLITRLMAADDRSTG